jgi:poly(3-hydroxybutyrate) depolymerase
MHKKSILPKENKMLKVMKYLMLILLLAGSVFAATSWTLKVGSRTAVIYAPDNRSNPALVISMHGIGGGTWWTPGAMKFEALADTANFVVAYPAGANSAWDLTGTSDVNFILAIIDSMYNRYQIDRNRVYASGFSMGGMMSWWLSCKIPDKIAAIVPGDGYPLGGMSGCSEVRHVPALQIHGTADDFVSYSGFVGSFLPSQITRYGCPTTAVKTSPYPVEVNGRNAAQLAQGSKSFMEYYGPCEKDGLTSELALLSVDGMIHDWATPDKLNTNDDTNYNGKPFDVNGTWEAWNFMKTHSLTGDIVVVVTPPTVSITSPTENSSFTAPATISVVTSASDADGSISHIDYFSNDSLIHSEWTAPYEFDWTDVTAGDYTLRAVAYDNDGNTASDTIQIKVEGSVRIMSALELQTGPVTYQVFDLQGRVLGSVVAINLLSLRNEIQKAFAKPGCYIVRSPNANGSSIQKIVIEPK